MATLGAASIDAIYAQFMRGNKDPISLTKADLRAAFVTADATIESLMAQAFGLSELSTLSDKQKKAQSGGASGCTVAICVAKTAGSVVGRSQMRFSQT